MRQLRDYGIYVPPGGLRPVFCLGAGGGYRLYDATHGAALLPRFTVHPDGTVTDWHGGRVSWRVEELFDTGRTFDPDVAGAEPTPTAD